ncbi:MAG: hypothetical protein AB7S78_14170 [Candidatus Omnitrophota bacterium]
MKLISAFELHRRSEKELCCLFHDVSQKLVRTKRNSPARRNALGTLENIMRARIAHLKK